MDEIQPDSTPHLLTLSDPGLEGGGQSPQRRAPKADMARAHVSAYHYVVVVVVFSLYVPSRRQTAKKRGARRKRISIRVSKNSAAVALRDIEAGTIFWLEEFCCLFHAMKQAVVWFVYARVYCSYVNIRLRRPRQGGSSLHYWSHFFSTTVAINSGTLKMASLQRREHASEEGNKL